MEQKRCAGKLRASGNWRRRVTVAETDTSPRDPRDATETRTCARRTGFGGESRACILHILSGVGMLAGGLVLLVAVS